MFAIFLKFLNEKSYSNLAIEEIVTLFEKVENYAVVNSYVIVCPRNHKH